mmetsp:Transcript_11729/g.11362  ORF Transcript_11729/g.11362 Transcript_11729/m.11362 type:complete len:345 (+) Transcript_11729:131-1165(+)
MNTFTLVVVVLVAVFSIILPISFSYFFGGQAALYVSPPYGFNDIPDLTGKVAIVTGSNTGIGYVTARELARKGAKVIVACRNQKKGQDAVTRMMEELGALPGANLLEYMKLDLGSFAEVRQFAKNFSYKRIKLDMLILNAGVMAPPFGLTVDGFETQIGTNHLGHFLLVKLLTPIIKSSKSRIVHVSSIGHKFSYPGGIKFSSFDNDVDYVPFVAYGQSKLANVLFSNEMARRFNGTGVTSNSLHPGAIKTELVRHIEQSILEGSSVVKYVYDSFQSYLELLSLDPNGGALTQLYVATSPKVEGVSGEYFVPIAIMTKASSQGTNATLGEMLWEESERLTKPFW